jgi:hypothetical protein
MVNIPIFADVFGSKAGEINVDQETISIKHPSLKLTVPTGYLYDVILVEKKELGKIKARIIVYDMVGMKNEIDGIMTESNFFLLKSFIKRE